MTHWDEKRRAWMPGPSRAALIIVLFFAIAALAAVTQIDLTTQVKGVLPEANGGTNQSTYTLGDLLYASASNTLSKLAGNITTTNKLLCQTGTGSNSAAPAWCTLIAGDIPSLDAAKISTGTFAGARVVGTATALRCVHVNSGGTALEVTGSDCGSGSSPNFASNETPTGTIDGTNATFTLAQTPVTNSLQLFKNGQLMIGGGADYTLTTNSITYVTAAKPKTGDVHLAYYRY